VPGTQFTIRQFAVPGTHSKNRQFAVPGTDSRIANSPCLAPNLQFANSLCLAPNLQIANSPCLAPRLVVGARIERVSIAPQAIANPISTIRPNFRSGFRVQSFGFRSLDSEFLETLNAGTLNQKP